MLDLVLRLTGAQSFGEIVPEFEEPPVQHLQDPADVARIVAVKIQRRQWGIRVARGRSVPVAFQELHRHQRVEKIADPARMHTDFAGQLSSRQFPIPQDREHP